MNCIRRAHTYWTTCACPNCVADRSRKRKLFSLGRPYRIPSAVAAQVLADRLDEGWTGRALASAIGVRGDYFTRHITAHKRGEPMPYIGPELARRIMTMGEPTEGQIGARGTRRRLRALATMGHSLEAVAADSGVGFSTLGMIRNGATRRVKVSVARAVAESFDRLAMRDGGNESVRRHAMTNEWHPPLAWDDIDVDATPSGVARREFVDIDEVAVQRVLSGDASTARRLNVAERTAVVEAWHKSGRGINELARLTGWKPERYRVGAVA